MNTVHTLREYVDALRDARVLFAMMDGGRDGVTRVCRETGVWQIGNVLDWVARDPQVYLASALADSGLCVQRAAADHAAQAAALIPDASGPRAPLTLAPLH